MATSRNPNAFNQDPTQSRIGSGDVSGEAGRRGRVRQVRGVFDRSARARQSFGQSAPPSMFSSENSPQNPVGYDPRDSTKLVNAQGSRVGAGEEITYGGGGPASFDATPPVGSPPAVSLTPAPPSQRPVATRAFAPTPHPAGGENIQINLDQPTQKEAANPLTGSGKPAAVTGQSQIIGAAPTVAPGRAMGFSSKGQGTPTGTDLGQPTPATPPSFTGGNGAMKRSFTNPTSASIYHSYVRGIFGDKDEEEPDLAGEALSPATA